MKIIVGILATAVLSASPANAVPAADPVFPRGLPYALTEDSCAAKRCVWNALEQGNREGDYSAILTRFDGRYLVKPITNRRAVRLTAAWCARPNVTCDGYWD